MTHILLLIVGVAIFVLGLLVAAHPPFQYWWYRFREIEKDKIVAENSEDYKNNVAFHMKLAGGRTALIGGLLTVYSLSMLGGEKLLLIAGIIFVVGLLLVGVIRIWKKLTSRK